MQKRKKHIISACSILFIVFLFLNVQHAAATPKKVLMGDFIVNNQKTVGAFVNSADSDATDLDPFTSYTSVYILDLLDRIDDINDEQAESWFFGQMDEAVATESLSNLYYSYLGHETSGGLLNDSSVAEKAEFVKSLQDNKNYGFSDSNETTENIVDTYYAIKALDAMGYLGDDEFGVQKANVVGFISNFWSN